MTYPRFAMRWIYDPVKVTQNKTRLDANYSREQDYPFLVLRRSLAAEIEPLVFKRA